MCVCVSVHRCLFVASILAFNDNQNSLVLIDLIVGLMSCCDQCLPALCLLSVFTVRWSTRSPCIVFVRTRARVCVVSLVLFALRVRVCACVCVRSCAWQPCEAVVHDMRTILHSPHLSVPNRTQHPPGTPIPRPRRPGRCDVPDAVWESHGGHAAYWRLQGRGLSKQPLVGPWSGACMGCILICPFPSGLSCCPGKPSAVFHFC
jgi:hypothetical protein